MAFGVSDIIELQTGAWWRPWWLLLLKAACLLSFAQTGYYLWWHQKRNGIEQEKQHESG